MPVAAMYEECFTAWIQQLTEMARFASLARVRGTENSASLVAHSELRETADD
jgi:hypothetical protein